MILNYLVLSAVLFLIGRFAARLAFRRGRSPQLWFLLGILFGLLSILILYLLPAKNKRVTVSTPKPTPPPEHSIWYYLTEDETQHGPITVSELRQAIDNSEAFHIWNADLPDWVEPSALEEKV